MKNRNQGQYVRNMAYAAVAGQAGCVSVPIIFGALFCGLWLDSTLDTKPAFTLILLVLSVPVSLVLMLQMVLRSVNQITPPPAVSTKYQIKDDDE